MSRLDDILSTPPGPGESHRWIMRALCHLLRERPEMTDVQAALTVAARLHDGHLPDRRREIADSVANARRWALTHPLPQRETAAPWAPLPLPPPPLPLPLPAPVAPLPRAAVNPLLCEYAEGIHRVLAGAVEGLRRDDALPEDTTEARRMVLSALYAPGDLVCTGPTVQTMATMTRDEWLGRVTLDGCAHVVPSPMRARQGETKRGTISPRALSAAAERHRYLVVEFDGVPEPWRQACRIEYIERSIPRPGRLVMIVHSGRQSLHAWFDVSGIRPSSVAKWWRVALILGADPQMWLMHQPARMPLGWRQDTDRRQEVVLWRG